MSYKHHEVILENPELGAHMTQDEFEAFALEALSELPADSWYAQRVKAVVKAYADALQTVGGAA